jgi:hypothetical protein
VEEVLEVSEVLAKLQQDAAVRFERSFARWREKFAPGLETDL